MKKQLINFSWPANLSDFQKDTVQENFSRGKLKVFYKGETADHRYFSDKFSEELVKSLPYTPVVSYYDEEKEDFVGHATEQQILGIVDPCSDILFEKDEDGNQWCVCDVVLYTERPDKVGDIAKKIVGHSQSLELDPKTVKYTINYDEKRHFKNIEFTAGTFVGVSVLGSDQKPAFTGSAFFSYNEDFESKLQLLKDYCEHKNGLISSYGGSEMNLQEFMKLSWGDISSRFDEALVKEYGEEAFTMIVDMFEDSGIVRFYSYIDGSDKLMRVRYSVDEEGNISLGNVNEVHVTYEDVVQVPTNAEETGVLQLEEQQTTQATEGSQENNEEIPVEEPTSTEPQTDFEETDITATATTTVAEENSSEEVACSSTEAAPVSNAEVTDEINFNQEVRVDNIDEESEENQENSSSTSFTESERAEFEELKREKKVNLLDSYKQYLSDEEYNDFMSKITSYEENELEVELLKAYKRYRDAEEVEHSSRERAFAFAPILNNVNNSGEDPLDSFVKKHLGQ